MEPKSDKVELINTLLLVSATDTLDNFTHISQVEKIVRSGRSGSELSTDIIVHFKGAVN
jgi:hypothetical protein